jgi:hypothetical protein
MISPPSSRTDHLCDEEETATTSMEDEAEELQQAGSRHETEMTTEEEARDETRRTHSEAAGTETMIVKWKALRTGFARHTSSRRTRMTPLAEEARLGATTMTDMIGTETGETRALLGATGATGATGEAITRPDLETTKTAAVDPTETENMIGMTDTTEMIGTETGETDTTDTIGTRRWTDTSDKSRLEKSRTSLLLPLLMLLLQPPKRRL